MSLYTLGRLLKDLIGLGVYPPSGGGGTTDRLTSSGQNYILSPWTDEVGTAGQKLVNTLGPLKEEPYGTYQVTGKARTAGVSAYVWQNTLGSEVFDNVVDMAFTRSYYNPALPIAANFQMAVATPKACWTTINRGVAWTEIPPPANLDNVPGKGITGVAIEGSVVFICGWSTTVGGGGGMVDYVWYRDIFAPLINPWTAVAGLPELEFATGEYPSCIDAGKWGAYPRPLYVGIAGNGGLRRPRMTYCPDYTAPAWSLVFLHADTGEVLDLTTIFESASGTVGLLACGLTNTGGLPVGRVWACDAGAGAWTTLGGIMDTGTKIISIDGRKVNWAGATFVAYATSPTPTRRIISMNGPTLTGMTMAAIETVGAGQWIRLNAAVNDTGANYIVFYGGNSGVTQACFYNATHLLANNPSSTFPMTGFTEDVSKFIIPPFPGGGGGAIYVWAGSKNHLGDFEVKNLGLTTSGDNGKYHKIHRPMLVFSDTDPRTLAGYTFQVGELYLWKNGTDFWLCTWTGTTWVGRVFTALP